MRKAALTAIVAALVGAGCFALVASGSNRSHAVDVRSATAQTARASSVHYSVSVRMVKQAQPLVLHIAGGASHDTVSVRLRLDDLTLSNGSTMPGTSGAIIFSKPFLYEKAPGAVTMVGNVSWLRLDLGSASQQSHTLSTVRSLTPSPLLRVLDEAKLRPAATPGVFAGPVAYDDPVVRTALRSLGGGLEFRNLRVSVSVARDGLVHRIRLTGRTPDGKTKLSLSARLYGFGSPVKIVPPKPGTFIDQGLEQLAS
jgi:hypothetical protein